MNNNTPSDPRNALYLTIRKIEGAYAHATIRAYRVDFLDFIEFCEKQQLPALPSSGDAVATFIESLVQLGKRSSSVRRAVSCIASIHQMNGLADPTKTIEAKLALRRMHRQIGRFSRQALGINEKMLESLLNHTENNLRGKRDRALLLMAYDSLCRRGELVSFRVQDIRRNMIDALNGSISSAILLRKSKTDQEAYGQWIKLSPRTLQAIDAWIAEAGLQDGMLFIPHVPL
jgi:site-specific recombinase XerD